MRVAVCQLNAQEDRSENLRVARSLLDRAAAAGADLAVLPEYVDHLGPARSAPKPEPVDGEVPAVFAVAGATALVVPAAFMLHTGRDHWEVLLRARAIENQCYVLAAGQIGDHRPGRTCFGRSMVVDPWGTVLTQAPDTVGVSVADLDPDRLATIRAELPSLANRRLPI